MLARTAPRLLPVFSTMGSGCGCGSNRDLPDGCTHRLSALRRRRVPKKTQQRRPRWRITAHGWLFSVGYGPFYSLHVRIGEPKVMADLMHQNVCDELAERFVALRPIVEQRAPIEKYHVGDLGDIHHAFPIETDALVEPHQVERAIDVQGTQDLVGGKILDANDYAGAECPKFIGQSLPGSRGKLLQLGDAWCAGAGP